MSTLTRAQARRVSEWDAFLAKPRLKRGRKATPVCVTCGAETSHDLAKGEPGYDCGPHEPITVNLELLERIRQEFKPKGRGVSR